MHSLPAGGLLALLPVFKELDMASNSYLVRVLVDGGCNERRAEAFERCLDDHPFCGINSTRLEAFLIKHAARNVEKFDNLMEQYQAREANPALRGEQGSLLNAFRH